MVRVKLIHVDDRARKEIDNFPKIVGNKIKAVLIVLSQKGKLDEPEGKKIENNLFEIRVKYNGQWRVLYAYTSGEYIIVLTAFHKKTQKTPPAEIKKAKKRLKGYEL